MDADPILLSRKGAPWISALEEPSIFQTDGLVPWPGRPPVSWSGIKEFSGGIYEASI
jgi:hypothetical protein